MVLQPLGPDFLGQIWIESGPIGERQNFAGARIFDNDGSGDGLRLLHRNFELPLGNVLDLLVDGENDVFARLGLLLNTAEPLLARVQ